jgi:hypothetical protein
MARFGQSFLQALTQPSYGQGLFELGGAIGGAPAAAAERKARQGMLEQLQTAISSNDPDVIENAATSIIKTDPKAALELSSQAKALRLKQRQQNAQSGLGYLQNQMTSVLKDESLSPSDKQEKLTALQQSANAIGGAVPGLDPMNISQMSMQAEDAVFRQTEARKASERADKGLQIRLKQLGLSEEASQRAAEQHREFMDTSDYRATKRKLELDSAQYASATQLARGLAGTEGGKEKFLQTYPDKEGVFTAIEKENEAKDLQLEKLRKDAEDGKFSYKEEDVRKMLGLDKDADVSTFMKLAKHDPKTANTVLSKALASSYASRTVPSAAMAGLFQEAALSYVQTLNLPGRDTEEKENAMAAKLALKAADAFVNGSSIDEAMLMFATEGDGANGETPEEKLAREFREQAQAFLDNAID